MDRRSATLFVRLCQEQIAERDLPWRPKCNDVQIDFSGMLYEDIHFAALNACVAHRLRFAAPGSAGAESLLLSAAEQELSRWSASGRSSHFCSIAALERSCHERPGAAPSAIVTSATTPALALCSSGEIWTPRGKFEKLAEDFASTLRIHTRATEDFLNLLHRSSSARAQATPAPGALPESILGPRELVAARAGAGLWWRPAGDRWQRQRPLAPDRAGSARLARCLQSALVRTKIRDRCSRYGN